MRVVVEGVSPEVDGGRFPAKRIVGDVVVVEADVFADGHDRVAAVVRYGRADESERREVPMQPLGNDRWRASFPVRRLGRYAYTVVGWVDAFLTWRRDLEKRVAAEQDVTVDLLVGARLAEDAAERAPAEDAARLREAAATLRDENATYDERVAAALDDDLLRLAARYPDRSDAVSYPRELEIVVDRERARFSTWYELFPRSSAPEPGRHGTFRDVEAWLPRLRRMGFDVLYLPPIHPIGRVHRKGKNNAVEAGPDDPGSPWAIGAKEGGHKSVHPELGTLQDFRRLVEEAKRHRLEIALDVAFQCAPDHPYVKEHPEWFRHRPDGTVQYAENPPKKYEDIYPFDFECARWKELWEELASIFDFWIDQGVRIFRVDNPHTKPFAFWEWCIGRIRGKHPDVIFLSEAFTRPKVMYRLAKLGFTQSYTYFAWRNHAWDLRAYLEELSRPPVSDFFRRNFWPNTPDILTEYLQSGGRPAFAARLVLAATLAASYGLYGPPFEHMEAVPREPGSEEYLDSEKYEIRARDPAADGPLSGLVERVNRIRRDNPALQRNDTLRFHHVDNDRLLCYSKRDEASGNVVVVVANVDPHHAQEGFVHLDLHALGVEESATYQMHDLIADARYLWQGPRNYVLLDPAVLPAHVFRLRRRLRSERDFDYYM